MIIRPLIKYTTSLITTSSHTKKQQIANSTFTKSRSLCVPSSSRFGYCMAWSVQCICVVTVVMSSCLQQCWHVSQMLIPTLYEDSLCSLLIFCYSRGLYRFFYPTVYKIISLYFIHMCFFVIITMCVFYWCVQAKIS